ncbi:MAG: M48 family metallopeptidase [Kiritimatiellia bacterium]
MLRTGLNSFDGIPVVVARKRIRRINLRVDPEGRICLSIPIGWATMAAGEAFLRANWKWCLTARARVLARPAALRTPPTEERLAALRALLDELHAIWTARLAEPDVTWRLRRMKTLWGSCNWRRRRITYNTDLAHAPRALVEYVVVHELSHLRVHNHGPMFRALMDARLPGWPTLRRRLNKREFAVA